MKEAYLSLQENFKKIKEENNQLNTLLTSYQEEKNKGKKVINNAKSKSPSNENKSQNQKAEQKSNF